VGVPGAGQPDRDAVDVERCLAGEREAYRALFDRYREVVFRVAYRLVGHKEDALDLTQEAFVRAFGSLDRFRGQASFKTYLLRIAVNACVDFRRRSKGAGAVLLEEEQLTAAAVRDARQQAETDPAQTAQDREFEAAFRRAVQELPEAQRATFVLHAVEGLSYAEVAETLGVAAGTVMSRIFYARQRLQEAMAAFVAR
jgi:RNA polymerase sigma-70 factor (ECF subfamily)